MQAFVIHHINHFLVKTSLLKNQFTYVYDYEGVHLKSMKKETYSFHPKYRP